MVLGRTVVLYTLVGGLGLPYKQYIEDLVSRWNWLAQELFPL
jgi:hypothetical protein